ncbi:MAG: Uma2 family endonuclease, partial [Sphaerospermopsis kisseleviana]
MTSVTLQIPQSLKFTDDEFVEIVAANKDLRLELSHQGELIVMSPTGGETGERNLELTGQVWFWNRTHKLGKAFDSSTGFKLPLGGTRSPDVSWIKIERWNA